MTALLANSLTDGKLDRRKVLVQYAELLKKNQEGTTIEDWLFISNQVLASMDELYTDSPLGEANPSNIIAGYGGVIGAKILEWGTLKKPPTGPREWDDPMDEDDDEGQKKKPPKYFFLDEIIPAEVLDEIMSSVKDLPADQLDVLLYYKDANGTVRSKINGREFGCLDVEHNLVWQT